MRGAEFFGGPPGPPPGHIAGPPYSEVESSSADLQATRGRLPAEGHSRVLWDGPPHVMGALKLTDDQQERDAARVCRILDSTRKARKALMGLR
jgi:hypothetical protein